MDVSLDRDLAVDLINYKLRDVQEIIQGILDRWGVTDATTFLKDSKEGKYPESENDAIDLKQLLSEERKLKALLKEM
ncbi:MAG: hypothetical protein ACFFCS_05340 [Candidatus Hodarchaeota archaeon]